MRQKKYFQTMKCYYEKVRINSRKFEEFRKNPKKFDIKKALPLNWQRP